MRSLVKVALGILVMLVVTLIGLLVFLLVRIRPMLH
jgi:hypothetical protein